MKALVAYRLLAPGSQWRLHREWFQRSALADLLGEDAALAEIHKLCEHGRLGSIVRTSFATDSPLEEDGFELSVPQRLIVRP